jgi:ankyrin repeat protein
VRIISCFSEFTYVQEDDRFSWYEDRLDLFDKLSSIVEDCPSKTRELHKRSLFLAFAKGDYSMLRKLFSYGVHCCYVDRKGDTILIKAVKAGNLEMVEFLFPYFQQSPTVPDINSLLKIAIQYQRKDMVCYFVVTRLANPNTVTEDGSTALMLAAEQGDLGFVTLFIGRGVNLNAKTASGWTALMFAAKTGNLDIVKYLAKQSADLSLESGYKETALTIAAKAGKKEVTEFLYQRTKARAKNTDFLLLLAIRQGWLDLAKVFAGNISLNRYCWHYGHLNAVINAFVEAATRENKEIVKFVLSEVYSSLAIQCALKACMLAGKKDMMIFLLNDCLETGDRGEVGVNVLIQAVIYNKKEMVVFLLKQGVDPHYGSTDDKTPLMTAAENGHIDLIRLFLDKGVDLSTQDNVKGMSALMYAALTGRTDSAKLLLDHENNLKKNRPIHQAVEYRDNFIDLTSVAPMDPGYPLTLVGSSISPPILSQVDKSGNNAFFIAVQNGALETVKLFLSYGININAANEQGYTPLMIAAKSEHLDIMKLLIEEQAEIDVKLNWGRGRGYFFEKAFLDKYHKFEGMLTVVREYCINVCCSIWKFRRSKVIAGTGS